MKNVGNQENSILGIDGFILDVKNVGKKSDLMIDLRTAKLFASIGFSYGTASMLTVHCIPEWSPFFISIFGLMLCLSMYHLFYTER